VIRGSRRDVRRGPVVRAARVVKAIAQPWAQLIAAAAVAHGFRRAHAMGANSVLAAVATAFVADRVGKRLVGRERPSGYRGSKPHQSFPSGHTAVTAAFSLSVARVLEQNGMATPPRATAAALLLTAGIAASRLALDEHWMSDVLGGAFLGATIAGAYGSDESDRVLQRAIVRRKCRGPADHSDESRPSVRRRVDDGKGIAPARVHRR
jgi:membrane-associated phospholipid phosphatase